MPTTCYGLFYKRSDGSTPSPHKLIGDIVYWCFGDAETARKQHSEAGLIQVIEMTLCCVTR
jgi:hypothetical protein